MPDFVFVYQCVLFYGSFNGQCFTGVIFLRITADCFMGYTKTFIFLFHILTLFCCFGANIRVFFILPVLRVENWFLLQLNGLRF